MPNRIIKESICTSDTIEQLTEAEEVFFYRLLVNCDDYGRLDARPQILRSRLYPLRMERVPLTTITDTIATLVTVGLISLYEVDGKPYLQVTTWATHQQIRAKHSKCPQPPTMARQCLQPPAPDSQCPQPPASDSNGYHVLADASTCPREYENREYENTRKNTCLFDDLPAGPATAPDDLDGNECPPAENSPLAGDGAPVTTQGNGRFAYPDDYEQFYAAFPRKIEKRAGYNAWRRLQQLPAGERPAPDTLLAAAQHYAAYCTTCRTDAQYIKHPASFLSRTDRPYEQFIAGVPALPRGAGMALGHFTESRVD